MDSTDETKSPIIRRLGSTRKLLVFNNIRLQLNEQLRCLDTRMDAQLALLNELQDFFRRRGEVEMDYSRSLDKLAKSLQLRHKEQKQKREQWPLFSTYAYWQQLIAQTKTLSKDHMTLSEVYSTHLVSRLSQVMEDVQRIYKRCREIGYETHEEILRVLHELHTTMKTYHTYRTELKQAEAKLKVAEMQKYKLGATLSQDKLERSRKFKLMEKEVIKRKNKYANAKLKALKARNEYVLCLEASNTTIHKYFVDDLSDLIDCMDFGFQNCVSRAFQMHVTVEEGRQKSLQNSLDALSSCISSLDSRLDKQRFLEHNRSAFMIPKKFEFQEREEIESKTDESFEPEIRSIVRREMQTRLTQLQRTVASLKVESEEVWKTLETTESTLLEILLQSKANECNAYFGEENAQQTEISQKLLPEIVKARQETEDFYLSKFREYLLGSSKIARLDAKQEYLRQSLIADSPEMCQSVKPVVKCEAKRRKRIGGRLQLGAASGQPKLFGGSLEEYQEATNQQIPLILRSCVRVINLYGLHHQGIFRVSGSQVEINNFRDWFERGEDPLADVTDASDINSVAGVLKLYLRELREPLFPIVYFEQFMEFAQLENKREFIRRMHEIVQALPRPVMIVLRYLFAFLNHLSEFSDENMMDPYNLAICFGPTLVPVPEDKEDQVQYQNQVNELIKNIIIYHEEIFPSNGDDGNGSNGPVYEKYIAPDVTCDDDDYADRDASDSLSPSSDHTSQNDGIDDSEALCLSDDDLDNTTTEAIAQYDFKARSDRELSFKKGDVLTLHVQVSDDWWRGENDSKQGLIPDKYISLKLKNDDAELSDRDMIISMSSRSNLETSSNDAIVSGSISEATNYVPASSHSETDDNDGGGGGSASSDVTSAAIWPSHINDTNTVGICAEGNVGERIEQAQIMVSPNFHLNETEKKDGSYRVERELIACRHSLQSDIEESSLASINFMENRDLWEKRAAAATGSSPASPLLHIRSQRLSEPSLYHTPDLVIDLPSASLLNLNHIEQRHEPDQAIGNSPESPEETAAETFAKQNQSTLKKNTKISADADNKNIHDFLMTITSPRPNRKKSPTLVPTAAATAVTPVGTSTSTFKPLPPPPPAKNKSVLLQKPSVYSLAD